MRFRNWAAVGLVCLGAALAGCSTGPTSSPAAVTTSASAQASGASTFITGGPPSSTAAVAPASPNTRVSGSATQAADLYTPGTAKWFFAKIEGPAIAAAKSTGIPASVLMGLAGEQTGFGTSFLANRAHNLFAQKCGKFPNCISLGGTRFREYPDWAHSLSDFATSMARSPLVAAALQAAPSNSAAIISAIAMSQRWVDPRIASDAAYIVSKYHLREADMSGANP